ncbi:gliding motility protein GldB-related protein [Inhella gelatinilytica]|uniref:Zn-dependent protease DUF2268 n=1 Tax=Inhella gelatinilytica TaxID=2795030 RepID=A0A931IWZ9_9BURK|nr:hypothetical protein [Inhella gelatinilytica]MBH9551416.1 hypothetical protein [Inhella gelatinilytica]
MKTLFSLLLILASSLSHASEDPLRAQVQTSDAWRFAKLFQAGKTSAEDLQAGYLDGAGRGVQIFTPNRIHDAAHLARQVEKRRADYAHAIATCLPLAESLNGELRAIYLAYRGLLPELPLPAVHWVFGAGNSGGTAAPDAQVLGLEVLCKAGTTEAEFRRSMRSFFAHETAHTWQPRPAADTKDWLLLAALKEGTPDLLAELVTGFDPDPAREAWARPREADLWRRFLADREILLQGDKDAANQAYRRWFANAGATFKGLPEGWPDELGYWVGRNIARAYLARAADPRAALRELLAARDPAALLAASGYAP